MIDSVSTIGFYSVTLLPAQEGASLMVFSAATPVWRGQTYFSFKCRFIKGWENESISLLETGEGETFRISQVLYPDTSG